MAAAGAVLLARARRPRRWAITAACGGRAGRGRALSPLRAALLAGAPWLVIAGIYVALRGWSYRDLVAAGPRLAAALRSAARSR